jgi:tetratricopeptide (TPR) repeat protein
MNEKGKPWGHDDLPSRLPDTDPSTHSLEPRVAFLWTRIDGETTLSDLADMLGAPHGDICEMVRVLADSGLVVVRPGVPTRPQAGGGPPLGQTVEQLETDARRLSRRPIPGKAPSRTASRPETVDAAGARSPRRTVSGELPKATVAPPAVDPRLLPAGPRREDLALLRRFGPLGHLPEVPFLKPGQTDRFGGFRFDPRELLEPCDLTLEQKKDIVFMHRGRENLDAFDIFNIAPTSDRKELRKGYFLFSKRFHPDNFFRKSLGSFAEPLQSIFKFGTDLHDRLQSDDAFREAYARAADARNALYRARLEAERVEVEQERLTKARDEANDRKVELQARLQSRVEARRARPDANPVVKQLDKAEQHYSDGMKLYKEEKFVQAASALQLAVTFDPRNETFRQAFERVNDKAKQARAEQVWKRGDMHESIGQLREALGAYREALGYWQRHDYLAHTAEVMLNQGEDLNQAAEFARLATEAAPQKVDYLLLLGRIYERVTLTKRAMTTYEKALKLDPQNEGAKKAVKQLKRM